MTWKVLLPVVLWAVLSDAVGAGGTELEHAKLVWADFDGDGLEDVYMVRPEAEDALFRNVGDGSFEDVTAYALNCVECASIEVAWRDVDLDRRPDLLRLSVSGSVELLRNGGNGAFEDVTSAAGLEGVTGANAARWLDYDADGRADLELTTESAPLVYHNLGDFLFEAVTFATVGRTAPEEGSVVRAIPEALDEVGESLSHAGRARLDDDRTESRRTDGGTVLTGARIAEVHPDPLLPEAPPVDPLEPNPDVDLSIPAGGLRCAWSVKDTSTGDCVLVSTLPTFGKLYPISANLFVSTGGDVGIGTTTPAARLDVAGTARVTDTLTLNPAGDQAIDVSTGSVYKNGLLFAHTKGGSANTALGQEALASVTTGSSNTASGFRALFTNTTGINNTASGVRALYLNTAGTRNTASGYRALYSNTLGHNNTASGAAALRSNTLGIRNTASGEAALRSNTSGDDNTASGARALYSNTTGDLNTASGYRALSSNTIGARNTANGSHALSSNTNGSYNTASGYRALGSNTTGFSNTASGYRALDANTTGSYNTASGQRALYSNTTGDWNTASGYRALGANTSGTYNTAHGTLALFANETGGNNTASGFAALRGNTEGHYNTATGRDALLSNMTGDHNTASGFNALSSNTTGNRNTASGTLALSANTTGHGNTAHGDSALYSNTIGDENTAIGQHALSFNTSGSNHTAVGKKALYLNTTGGFCTAVGSSALHRNKTGSFNTAVGFHALHFNDNGSSNTAIGLRSLYWNTTGSQNTASGSNALGSNTTGFKNTASGYAALQRNSIGYYNTASGLRALYSNTTGDRNIGIGQDAGSALTTGNDNIMIGNSGVAAEEATIRVGTDGTHTRAFVAGIHGVTTGVADAIPVVVDSTGQLGTVSSSRRFKKDVADMGDATERLLELRPVVFRYKQEQELPSGEVPLEYGLIAEEVAEVFPDLVVYDEEGLPFTVKYHLLSSMLLNEVKKLHERLGAQSVAHAEKLACYDRKLEELHCRLFSTEPRDSSDALRAAASADSR